MVDQKQQQPGGGTGFASRTKFNQPGSKVFGDADLQRRNYTLIIEGDDGEPQVWSNGDQTSAADMLRRAAPHLGVKEIERA